MYKDLSLLIGAAAILIIVIRLVAARCLRKKDADGSAVADGGPYYPYLVPDVVKYVVRRVGGMPGEELRLGARTVPVWEGEHIASSVWLMPSADGTDMLPMCRIEDGAVPNYVYWGLLPDDERNAVMKAAWERLQEMDACASEEDL